MKSLKDHPFFKIIEMAEVHHKKIGQWGAGNAYRKQFFMAIKSAHPFIFDKKVTCEKRLEGRYFEKFRDLVEDFSLPFKTSLYLMTDGPTYVGPDAEGSDKTIATTLLGYLIHEIDPEKFMAFEVCSVEADGRIVPVINQFSIDLRTIEFALMSAEQMGFEIFNKKTEAHVLKETSSIFSFTSSISVKRIGVEKGRSFSIRSKDIGVGYTSVKVDNLIHIADKVEYEYVKPIEQDGDINWEWSGFWRGHWRAFYTKDAIGDNKKDSIGRNLVDFSKVGKNRQGEYVVPGYTWVVEHTKGNSAVAEIKTRIVKHGS